MKSQSRLSGTVLAVFAVFAAGCTSKPREGGNVTDNLVGAGSTFSIPVMTGWAVNFQLGHPYVEMEYLAIGSGAGKLLVRAGIVEFGARDVLFVDEKMMTMPPVMQVPVGAG